MCPRQPTGPVATQACYVLPGHGATGSAAGVGGEGHLYMGRNGKMGREFLQRQGDHEEDDEQFLDNKINKQLQVCLSFFSSRFWGGGWRVGCEWQTVSVCSSSVSRLILHGHCSHLFTLAAGSQPDNPDVFHNTGLSWVGVDEAFRLGPAW